MTSTQMLAIKDVATELAISKQAAHHLVQSGDLAAINVGRGSKSYWRISRSDLEAYIERERELTARRFRSTAS